MRAMQYIELLIILFDIMKFHFFDEQVQKKLRDSVRVFRKQQQTKIEQLKEATLNVEEDDAGARSKIRLVFLARQSHVFMTQGLRITSALVVDQIARTVLKSQAVHTPDLYGSVFIF